MDTLSAMTVPMQSMLFMALSALISFGLPLFVFFFFRKRLGLKAAPMLVGMASFIVFALILEQLLHVAVLSPGADGSIALMQSPWLYTLYGAFAAGIFEETGRFVCFHILKRKYPGAGTGPAYGIGHGGIEAMLIVGLTMVSNLVVSALMNAGGAAALMESAPQVAVLATTEPVMFLVGGIERAFAISIQISLSIFVWVAVNRKGKFIYYPIAILLHAAVGVPAALMQAGALTSILAVEAGAALSAVILAVAAVKLYQRNLSQENAPVLQETAYEKESGEKDA